MMTKHWHAGGVISFFFFWGGGYAKGHFLITCGGRVGRGGEKGHIFCNDNCREPIILPAKNLKQSMNFHRVGGSVAYKRFFSPFE